jgi:hypothetical protein
MATAMPNDQIAGIASPMSSQANAAAVGGTRKKRADTRDTSLPAQ